MTRLKFNLFGSPQLLCDGEAADISLRKGLALVIYLAVTGQPHTRDAIATMFWPDSDQQSGRANVRRTLYRLNQALGEDVLATTSETIEINPKIDVWIDTEVFRQHATACLGTRDVIDELAPACEARLTQAAALYTDDFLAGFTLPDSPDFDEWQFFQTESLRQLLARVLEQLAHTHEQRGAFDTAIEYARRRLALDPLHEPAHRRLMRVYALAGQRAAAVRQYRECVRLLEAELGVPPEEATTELYEAIQRRELSQVQTSPPDAAVAVSPPTAPPPSNLPAQLTPFVGRDDELAALERFIGDPSVRLVTIVGVGGMGKTRLAVAAAERQLERVDAFSHGVYLVPLASVERVERIVSTIAEVLNFPFDAGGRQARSPREQLLDYLHSKRLLLLLDNFEHLLDGADLLTEILQTAAGVKLLVTSRERLYLQEEHLLAIQGLDLPDAGIAAPEDAAGFTAVQLFVQSAQRVQHNFELTAENTGDVVRICRLAEGMPLGVELAAAWLDVMPPAEIAAEIEESLDFLETQVQNVPARQRSIRAVFDSTWNQLAETERAAFAQLSVFRGGFTRDAARYVTRTDLRMLATLVDKSLIQYHTARDRYQLHELLRQYGAAKLAEEPAEEEDVRDRHSAYYCGLLRRRQEDIEGAHKRSALEAIDLDIDNILAAWNYAVARGDVVRLDQAMHALEHHSYWRGRFYEAEALFHHAVVEVEQQRLPSKMDIAYRRVLAGLWARHANFSYLLGHWDRARGLFERSLQTFDELADAGVDVRLDRAYVLMKMADVTEDLADARDIFQQSLDLYRAAGHDWWAAGLLCHLGYVALAAGDYDEARAQFEAGLAQYNALGDRWQFGWVLDGLSNVLMHQNQLTEAERLARESLEIHRDIGLRDRIADSLATLSWITLAAGNREDAYSLYQEALSIWDDLGVSPVSTPSARLEAQPLSPRWFGDILNQRMTAVAADLPADVIARALDHADATETPSPAPD